MTNDEALIQVCAAVNAQTAALQRQEVRLASIQEVLHHLLAQQATILQQQVDTMDRMVELAKATQRTSETVTTLTEGLTIFEGTVRQGFQDAVTGLETLGRRLDVQRNGLLALNRAVKTLVDR